MATPYIGEIRMFGGTFAPYGWSFCNGSLLPISQYSALFQLIGTTYGGDGVNTFALPDLQGRLPIHQGQGTGLQNYVIGSKAGSETVTLVQGQLPVHNHGAIGSATGSASSNPTNNTWGNNAIANKSFGPGTSANATMNNSSLSLFGNNLPHDNLMPFQAISFIIALEGVYPTQG
jgi:microcystin-dependent protein